MIDLVEMFFNNDVEREKIIALFNRVGVPRPRSLGQNPDSVEYHPNLSRLDGFRRFPNSMLMVYLAPEVDRLRTPMQEALYSMLALPSPCPSPHPAECSTCRTVDSAKALLHQAMLGQA